MSAPRDKRVGAFRREPFADDELANPNNVVDLDSQRPHAVGHVVCRACGHHHVGVVDMRADFDNLRCSACDQMTAAMQPDPPGQVVRGPWSEPA